MFKFVDGFKINSKHEDEILLRCNCGCEIVSLSIAKLEETLKYMPYPVSDDDIDVALKDINTLTVSFLSLPLDKIKKKDVPAYSMVFPSNEALLLLNDILQGKVNNGGGGVESLNGSILSIQRAQNEQGETDGVYLMGFRNSKAFVKYGSASSIKKANKYVAWEIYLDSKDYATLSKQFDKIITKRLLDFGKTEEDA